MRLVRELLNDVSVDTNMDVTHAESYTHNRQTQRRKKVVNTLYKETAEKINTKQPNKAKKIERRRLRWCIECCLGRLRRGEDPASGAGIKVEEYAAPPPIDETQHHTPQAGARHNFNKKAAETVNHWGDGRSLPRPQPRRGNPTHQTATRSKHKALKHMTKHAGGLRPERSRRGM